MTKSKGFSAVEVIIVIIIVAIIGVAGYIVYDRLNGNPSEVIDVEGNALVEELPEAPEIESSSDLEEATTVIDSVDLDASNASLTELQAELDKF
ncbi:MAG TPA: prepilin-type N-terminal cleavage/methylation domain-containing protein [Candidatus Saccharibacteria bacterium]|nr:prepilin-type N-terminal cleavage/methylation domain-containing protein [Candidatus Saccharibacteria bacterium]